jgi:hypothetical protein
MSWWNSLSEFWRGFICGGLAVPAAIVAVEVVVKMALRKK